ARDQRLSIALLSLDGREDHAVRARNTRDLQIAMQLHQQGKWGEAESLYRKVLESDRNDADAMHLLGVLCAQQKRFDEAEQWIRRAIARQPTAAGYYQSLGSALRERGQFADAIDACKSALRLKPDLIEAQITMSQAL